MLAKEMMVISLTEVVDGKILRTLQQFEFNNTGKAGQPACSYAIGTFTAGCLFRILINLEFNFAAMAFSNH
jgi:hypothetical protein